MLFVGVLVAGGLAAAVAGLIVGVPSLRLRGDYLAIVTLGFGEIIRVIIQNTDAVGGATGYKGIPHYTTFFWAYAVAALTIYLVVSLIDSTYGRGFLTVRDDEVAAEAMGINTTARKVVAFVSGRSSPDSRVGCSRTRRRTSTPAGSTSSAPSRWSSWSSSAGWAARPAWPSRPSC